MSDFHRSKATIGRDCRLSRICGWFDFEPLWSGIEPAAEADKTGQADKPTAATIEWAIAQSCVQEDGEQAPTEYDVPDGTEIMVRLRGCK